MKNDIAATAEQTNSTKTPAVLGTHGAAFTASAERLASNTQPGAREVTLATTTSADRTAGRPTLVPGAALASTQWEGRFYAPAMPRDLPVAFDATHVARPDQINLRRYQVKRDRNGNLLSPGANRRVTRCPLRTSAL